MDEKTVKEIKKTDGHGLDTLRRRTKKITNKKGKGSEYNRAKEKNKKIEDFWIEKRECFLMIFRLKNEIVSFESMKEILSFFHFTFENKSVPIFISFSKSK